MYGNLQHIEDIKLRFSQTQFHHIYNGQNQDMDMVSKLACNKDSDSFIRMGFHGPIPQSLSKFGQNNEKKDPLGKNPGR